METAYTVGSTSVYEEQLKRGEFKKLGRTGDYAGGWVWKDAEEAHAFLKSAAFRYEFNALRSPEEFSVYLLELPGSWQECVSAEPDPSDGVHRLLVDARVVRRAVLS